MLAERRSAYFAGLDDRRQKLVYRWAVAKQTTWLALLSGGYLILYLLELLEQSFHLLGIHL
jgi:hypothetical protein